MTWARIDEDEWVTTLAVLLSEHAQDVYSAKMHMWTNRPLRILHCIRRAYGVTASNSRLKLNQLQYDHLGNFSQHFVQVQTFLRRWLEFLQWPY